MTVLTGEAGGVLFFGIALLYLLYLARFVTNLGRDRRIDELVRALTATQNRVFQLETMLMARATAPPSAPVVQALPMPPKA